MIWDRRLAALTCVLWLACATARAQCVVAPELSASDAAEAAVAATQTARGRRMVAPVFVNGRGPFRFIVDTGANRSVLSSRLAAELGLAGEGSGEVHSVHGVATAPLVAVESLRFRALSLGHAAMPVIDSGALAGEHGLLGVDGMRGRLLRMDFARQCIEITPARGAGRLRDWTAVQGVLRFGHLVVIEGEVHGVRANLLVDTGADASLANTALRQALSARLRRHAGEIAYTAGDPILLDNALFIQRMTLGEVSARNVTAYVGDFHIFQLWGLADEPTLLIGMDVLTQARGLAIDYERAVVYFQPPG